MKELAHSFTVGLPNGWQTQLPGKVLDNDTDKMKFVLNLAAWNISNRADGQFGGPFAAAVFDIRSHELVSIGVNQVVPANCSLAHAEAVAIALAQQQLQTYDLSSVVDHTYEMFASGQPCVQCFGMTWWSGIQRLVIGARASDIEDIAGFDEGPLPADWQTLLSDRGSLPPVSVVSDICRDEARQLLQNYVDLGGTNYSPGLS